jgi:hypothetical protein
MKVNESTYENYFLLYIDNELTATEKAVVDSFVLTNPTYAAIFNKLQQTKLTVTNEIYEDKVLLYRFDEMEAGLDSSFKQSLYRKEAVVIRPNFKKQYYAIAVSVAALFILVFGYQNLAYKKGVLIKQLDNTVARTENEHTYLSKEEGGLVIKEAPSIKKITQPVKPIIDNISSSNKVTNVMRTETDLTQNEGMDVVSSEVLAHENYTSNPITTSMSDATILVTTSNIQQELINEQGIEYNEIDTDDNDRVIFIASFEVDADKFRGITRKVGSLFKRNKTNKEK